MVKKIKEIRIIWKCNHVFRLMFNNNVFTLKYRPTILIS